jgi:Kef-type K+ transport system membrane component KefB
MKPMLQASATRPRVGCSCNIERPLTSGQIIVASAILEDTIGWIIVAIAFGLAASGTLDVWSVVRTILGAAVFLAASLTIGRRIVFRPIRWTNDNFVSDFPVITTILAIMIAMALTTHSIGVHSVLGAFVAGVLVGESHWNVRHSGRNGHRVAAPVGRL